METTDNIITQLHPGDIVSVFGREGIVETTARSIATNTDLVTVAFDPRTRIRFDRRDVVFIRRVAR